MDYLKRLTHCTFTCKDYHAMVRFYGETLGLKKVFTLPYNEDILQGFRDKGYQNVTAKPGDEWISYFEVAPKEFVELFNLPYNGENDTQDEGFHHFCLLVDDIVAAARELEGKGVTLWNGPKWMNNPLAEPYPADPIQAGRQGQCGSLAFYIQDPEGNEIEIMQYTPDSLQLKCQKVNG